MVEEGNDESSGATPRASETPRCPIGGLTLFVVLSFVSACGPSETEIDETVTPAPPGTSDAGVDGTRADVGPIDGGGGDISPSGPDGGRADGTDATDARGPDTADGGGPICGDVTCRADEECVEQVCVPKSREKCQKVDKIGTIAPGESLEVEGTFGAGADDSLQNACTGNANTPEKVYRLEVAEGLRVNPTVETGGEFSATVEFRRDCRSRNDETDVCSTGSRSLYAEAGTNWYVIVEKDAGVPGDFTLTLQASKACSFGPPGVSTCRNDHRFVCQEGANTQKFECPVGCIDEDCHGHSCNTPIMINGVGDGQTYRGDMAAYEANINFANGDKTCKIDDVAAASKGAEVYFKVEADKEDEIVVDTSGDAWDNLVYITNRCSSVTSGMFCHASWETDQEKTWSVPKDGTYWVIIDKRYIGSGDPEQDDSMFDYTVDVR